jgi:nicotinamide-nucleotide amidase
LDHWENTLPESISLAYLPSPGQVRMRLTARGKQRDSLEKDMALAIEGLKKRIGGMIFGYDKTTMQEVVGKLLLEKKQSLATAESCTGGYMAHLITSVPGSSAYYKGSIVSYHNAIKENQLSVDPGLIETEGAVSEAVVRQMAENGRVQLQADWCIASSGIAGPEGGTESKPVGLVWIALAGPEGVRAKEFRFGKRRLQNIQVSAMAGLNMLRIALINL